MPTELADLLDFELARARSRPEISRTSEPYELPLIEHDLATWLGDLEYAARRGIPPEPV
jgi:hypothetical protein